MSKEFSVPEFEQPIGFKTGGSVTPSSNLDLTNEELSALIEACNVAQDGGRPRPPWNSAGSSAWYKLVEEERRRGSL